jgi:hypothetical protein
LLGKIERSNRTKNHPGVIKNNNHTFPLPKSSSLRQHNEKSDTKQVSANGINTKSTNSAMLEK